MNEKQMARWERRRRMGKTKFTILAAAAGIPGAFFPLIPFLLLAPKGQSPTYLLAGVAVACVVGVLFSVLLARWSWDNVEEKYRIAKSRSQSSTMNASDGPV